MTFVGGDVDHQSGSVSEQQQFLGLYLFLPIVYKNNKKLKNEKVGICQNKMPSSQNVNLSPLTLPEAFDRIGPGDCERQREALRLLSLDSAVRKIRARRFLW